MEGSYAHHYTTNAAPQGRRPHDAATPLTPDSAQRSLRRRAPLSALRTQSARPNHSHSHTHASAAPRSPSQAHSPTRTSTRTRTCTHTPVLPDALACWLLQPGPPAQAGAPGAAPGRPPPGPARHTGGSGPARRTPPVPTHLQPNTVGLGLGGARSGRRASVSAGARALGRLPAKGFEGSGAPVLEDTVRGWGCVWGVGGRGQRSAGHQCVCPKRTPCLPVGESNPGLPRDRRGYSPLY